jgi:hypothetical protein
LILALGGVVIMVLFLMAASEWPLVALILVAGLVYVLPVSPLLWRWGRRQTASISSEENKKNEGRLDEPQG